MTVMDYIQSALEKVLPPKSGIPAPITSGKGIGHTINGHFEDDMIVSKPAVIFHSSQAFFNFLAMCCLASVASFQAHWGVGPSGLTGFAIFVSVSGILLSLFLMLVPVIDIKYGKFTRLSRALAEVRVGFILIGTGTATSLLVAFILTISAWTEPGCKDASKDPHAGSKPDGFKNGLGGWCTTKKAGAIFFWLAFAFWFASLVLRIFDWRNGKSSRPRDPPFNPPIAPSAVDDDDYEEEDEHTYGHLPPMRDDSNAPNSPFNDTNRPVSGAYSNAGGYSNTSPRSTSPGGMPASRPSLDAYGAFSDPPPSGFGVASGLATASQPQGVSRTMQYADPYAAVRASLVSTTAPVSSGGSPYGTPASAGRQGSLPPPSYEYTGYRP